MSRIEATFSALKAQGRKALIPYVTAGFPFADITPALMHGMVEAGADVIELGVPFSDPMADGPVIQKAGEKALSLGVGMVQVLDQVREFRKRNNTTPVVLMGYANPVERYDQKHGTPGTTGSAFVRDAAAAGVDGVLIVDYPPEECEAFAADLRAHGMDVPIDALTVSDCADAVAAALKKQGIAAHQIQRSAQGGEQLTADCRSSDCRRAMRRVDLVFSQGGSNR